MKEEEELMEMVDGTKPTVSPDMFPYAVEVMGKVRTGLYPIYLIQNVDFRELVDQHEPTHGSFIVKFCGFGAP